MLKYESEILTQENRCELNNIRYEIMNSKIPAVEKLARMDIFCRGILENYSPSDIIGAAYYELELCRKRQKEIEL
ncbi:hypothetical protein R83H12_00412 [Fibrobacteria bacterium R8-3-H12]